VWGSLALCAVALSACTSSPSSSTHHQTSSTTTSRPTSATTTTAAGAPTPLAATYTDVPAGQPGYALVVNPGPAGSGSLGGIAVYQYQDGAQSGYFSFSGTASSGAPFSLSLKGDRTATTVMAQVTPPSSPSGSSITIENCAPLFSPTVPTAVPQSAEPGAPPSCTFTYKLAPGPPRTQPTTPTNQTATPAIKSDLLTAYLQQEGWQSYASSITNRPGSTYVAYDPATGLDWANATFTYSGPDLESGNVPSIGMQDGGDQAFFYEIPVTGTPPSGDPWVMVGAGGDPTCYARSVIPQAVIGLWSLTDPPVCG